MWSQELGAAGVRIQRTRSEDWACADGEDYGGLVNSSGVKNGQRKEDLRRQVCLDFNLMTMTCT